MIISKNSTGKHIELLESKVEQKEYINGFGYRKTDTGEVFKFIKGAKVRRDEEKDYYSITKSCWIVSPLGEEMSFIDIRMNYKTKEFAFHDGFTEETRELKTEKMSEQELKDYFVKCRLNPI